VSEGESVEDSGSGPVAEHHGHHRADPKGVELRGLVLAALGIVYGDIGTSPLYALRECFNSPHHPLTADPVNVFGVLSLIVWSLIVVVSVKYLAVVMRADNQGEGGILALMALVRPKEAVDPPSFGWFVVVGGLFGAALLYGDGVITPAISVLSAVEGLGIATHALEPFVIPITIVILIGLFSMQSQGTAAIGRYFGPIMVVWFVVLAGLGLWGISGHPAILAALSPHYGIAYLAGHGWVGLGVLGSVFLVCTGGEALYADMGHFGRKPIQVAWFVLVIPALLLNYFGQGALVLSSPASAKNPFYLLAPSWATIPLVVLATMATIIASQAMISGSFSLTKQAIQLGYAPRVSIRHTSAAEIGQIYVPSVNFALLVATIALVLGFKSSSALASAYGIAVSTTMVITTLLAAIVAARTWKWSTALVVVVFGFFLVIESAFLVANGTKILDGGWFPLAVGVVLFTLMATWNRGRRILGARLADQSITYAVFRTILDEDPPLRVPGTAIFLTADPERMPPSLMRNLAHNRVLHARVVLLTVVNVEVPTVAEAERYAITELGTGLWRATVKYGFMEDPDVPRALERMRDSGRCPYDEEETTFFVGRDNLLPTDNPGMALWREQIFAYMLNNAQRAMAFYKIPPGRVIEIGAQLEI
jgi:KUP system potassium uptake protein